MKKRVDFYVNSSMLHFTQLVTGLELLNQKGVIDLKYSLETNTYPIDLCRVNYNGKILIFDLTDSSVVRENIYKQCDFYIKRMLLKEDFQKMKRLFPYGLNYSVFLENPFMRKLLFSKKFYKNGIRYNPAISRMLRIKNSINSSHLRYMQAPPARDFKIIFRARLWNPENNVTPWKKKEREKMNWERIEINKGLKAQFGNLFDGGIERDSLSEEVCPELLLSDKVYHKENYLKQLKKSSVGIITEGLEQSIGWKLGEYVAHSLAILSYPIDKFQLLGDFRNEKNYLAYTDQKELITKINFLQNNDDLRMDIQHNNYSYYREFLEPSAKLQKILKLVDEYQ